MSTIKLIKPTKVGTRCYTALRTNALQHDPDCFADVLDEEIAKLNPTAVADFLSRNTVLGAYANGKAIGMAVSSPRGPARLKHVCEIGQVFVRPDLRQAGTARRIIQAHCAMRAQQGYKLMVASVSAANVASLKTFAAVGFAEYGRLDGEFMSGNGPVAGVHLSRNLVEGGANGPV